MDRVESMENIGQRFLEEMIQWRRSSVKNILISPKYYKGESWYSHFFNMLHEDMGFEIFYTDGAIDIPKNTKIVIAFGVPHFNWPDQKKVDMLVNLNSSIYLIVWTTDLHCGDLVKNNKKCKENTLKIFDKCNLILSSYDNRMKSMYRKYLDKYIYFPWCFATHERYMKFEINKDPIMKCLMVGASGQAVYPLRFRIRKYALKNKHGNIVYVNRKEQEAYAALLHEYFCGIVDIGHNEVVQPKYFEIPAVGSLLLGRRTNLIDDLGFIPYKHYVPFGEGKDVFKKTNEIISNPDKYEDIRIEGMNFSREHHSINNRMDFMYDVLRKIL
ncbi:MAG: glycosyltransferase [Candidatus Thorarchaeota archaeon]|jgi:hypothetical protein